MSRPYLEIKVVRKPKVKCEHNYIIQIEDMPLRLWECANCEKCFTHPPKNYKLVKGNLYEKQEKGSWVNGENLDKIKFPCFCSFETGMRDYKRYGELDHIVCRDFSFYRIRELKQVGRANKEVFDCQYIKSFLKDIIETFDVHILRGEIILFEEQE